MPATGTGAGGVCLSIEQSYCQTASGAKSLRSMPISTVELWQYCGWLGAEIPAQH